MSHLHIAAADSSDVPEWAVVPRRVYLYEDPSAPTLDVRRIARGIRETTGLSAGVRREFFLHHPPSDLEALAADIAATRVTDLHPNLRLTPVPPALVYFERRRLDTPERGVPGVLYDGFQLQAIYRATLPPAERSTKVTHIAFSSRLLGTFDDADRRYHARAVVLGYPALISTTGIVEAPAKPRGFYVAKRGLRIVAADARYEALKERFAGRFVDWDDPRLTQVARGYALQALFYAITGEPFCDDEDCVLFNAHWQEELLHAQIESGLLCARHRKVAEALRARPDGRRTRPR